MEAFVPTGIVPGDVVAVAATAGRRARRGGGTDGDDDDDADALLVATIGSKEAGRAAELKDMIEAQTPPMAPVPRA